jgi:hypothetical protein
MQWGLALTDGWTLDPSIPVRPHPSWRVGETAPRSHDSGYYGTRFMLRLDEVTSSKLATLTQTFHRSAAEVIRQLIAQTRPEDFPQSWHLAVDERRPRQV